MTAAALTRGGSPDRLLHVAAPGARRGALRDRRRAGRPAPSWRRSSRTICAARRSAARGRAACEATPTFFEVATAAAFELFRRRRVDVAVLEVGLGGRLDATDVASPRSRRHHEHRPRPPAVPRRDARRDRLREGRHHQAGHAVVCGERTPEPLDVIAAACADRGARLIRGVGRRGAAMPRSMRAGPAVTDLRTPARSYAACTLAPAGPSPGPERPRRGAAARGARSRPGSPCPRRRSSAALRDATMARPAASSSPGGRPPRAARRGAQSRRERDAGRLPRRGHPGGQPLVFAAMRDKDHAGMLRHLLPYATQVVLTRPPTPRAAAPDEVLADVMSLGPELRVEVEPDPVARGWTALVRRPGHPAWRDRSSCSAPCCRSSRPGRPVTRPGPRWLVSAGRVNLRARLGFRQENREARARSRPPRLLPPPI